MSIDIWRLTSIKLLTEVYNGFKDKGRMENVTLQKLVNRAMWLYLNDDDFASKINQKIKGLN